MNSCQPSVVSWKTQFCCTPDNGQLTTDQPAGFDLFTTALLHVEYRDDDAEVYSSSVIGVPVGRMGVGRPAWFIR